MDRPLGMVFFVFAAFCNCDGAFAASENRGLDPQPEMRTLTLQGAVRMTLARSPEIMIAEAQAKRAGDAVRESRALNRPQVVAGTGVAYNNGFPLSIEGSAPSIFQIGASQPILSKKNANLIRESKESGKASQLGAESARNELAAKTASVYYNLHRARKTIALATARLDTARKQQELVETLFGAGKVRPVDVTLSRTAAISAQHQLLVVQEQEKMAATELQELTGLTDIASAQTVEPRIDNPIFELQGETLYQQSLSRTPEILKAEANVRAKEFHVAAEKGEYLPRIEIVSEYALFSRTNNYVDYFSRFVRNNFLIGFQIKVPVFDGFRASARVAQSRQEVSEARYQLEHVKSGLKVDIQRGLSDLRIARSASDLARSDVEAAREMVQVSETLLGSGRISAKELEDSRSQLQQKELALLDADQVLFQRKLELLQTAGSIASAIQ
jgi:outer membrane protein